MDTLFAQIVLRILQLRFDTKVGWNPDMISFHNQSGQGIYVHKHDNTVEISCYRTSGNICYGVNIINESQIETVVDKIKEKLNCIDIKSE